MRLSENGETLGIILRQALRGFVPFLLMYRDDKSEESEDITIKESDRMNGSCRSW